MDDRRRRSPRRDERYPRGHDDREPESRRRPRSQSPGDRFRRDRSPGAYKRHRGNEDRFNRGGGPGPHRRGGRQWEDRERGGGGRGFGPRGGGGPNAGPIGPRGRGSEPMPFREFAQTLRDDVGGEEAASAYQAYLADWWGGADKAEFEQHKDDPALRLRFDPRELRPLVEARAGAARETARAFALARRRRGLGEEGLEAENAGARPSLADMLSPEAPPGPAGFWGALPAALEKGDKGPKAPPPPPPRAAPALTWHPDQVAADLELAQALARSLDAEKGIEEGASAWQEQGGEGGAGAMEAVEAAKTAEDAAGDEKMGERREAADGQEAAHGQETADGENAQNSRDDRQAPLPRRKSASPPLEALDLALAYLWAVHGVDYYGGRELCDPGDPPRGGAGIRTVRAPKPPEAEEGGSAGGAPAEPPPRAAVAAAAAAEAAAEAGGAPVSGGKRAAAEEYERRVGAAWRRRLERGDPLAARLREAQVEAGLEAWVEAQIVMHDEKKWGNKLSAKLFVAREFVVKHIRNKQSHLLDAERERLLDAAYWDNFAAARAEDKARGREDPRTRARKGGAPGPPPPGRMGAGPGGGMMAPMPGMAPAAGMPGMGPIIMAPLEMIMGMQAVPGGGRGRGGGRGGGRGRGRGPPQPQVFMPAPAQAQPKMEYFDLDAPRNNRAVLDYGDL